MPPIKVYTRAGGLIVEFIYVENDNSVLNKTDVYEFHCSMMDICAGKHISGKYIFDLDDPRVSKGLIVPLKSNILEAIETNTIATIIEHWSKCH